MPHITLHNFIEEVSKEFKDEDEKILPVVSSVPRVGSKQWRSSSLHYLYCNSMTWTVLLLLSTNGVRTYNSLGVNWYFKKFRA